MLTLGLRLQIVTWVCDPMHGNTETVSNFKTRRYENIRAEVGLVGPHAAVTAGNMAVGEQVGIQLLKLG